MQLEPDFVKRIGEIKVVDSDYANKLIKELYDKHKKIKLNLFEKKKSINFMVMFSTIVSFSTIVLMLKSLNLEVEYFLNWTNYIIIFHVFAALSLFCLFFTVLFLVTGEGVCGGIGFDNKKEFISKKIKKELYHSFEISNLESNKEMYKPENISKWLSLARMLENISLIRNTNFEKINFESYENIKDIKLTSFIKSKIDFNKEEVDAFDVRVQVANYIELIVELLMEKDLSHASTNRK